MVSQKKRTFRIIILQADTSERSPGAAWSLQARLVGLDGLWDCNDDSESAFFWDTLYIIKLGVFLMACTRCSRRDFVSKPLSFYGSLETGTVKTVSN